MARTPLPTTPTGAIQNKVAVKLAAFPAASAIDDLTKIAAAFTASDILDNVTAFGPLSLRGNNATWLEFGNDTEASLPAPATPNEFPLTWVITEDEKPGGGGKTNEADASANPLLDASVGDDIWAVLLISTAEHAPHEAAAGDVAYVVGGAVSGVDINFDTPRSCTLNIAVDRRPARVTQVSSSVEAQTSQKEN